MLLFLAAMLTKAQIPNNGFETWTSVGNYENPTGVWLTTNSFSSTSFYPITKTTDHYPLNVGNYAVKISNNISLLPNLAGIGILQTNTSLGSGKPMFPITGHPNSLRGYYKFNQQNNDTMRIVIALYKNGSVVSSGIMDVNTSISNWTSFNIPLSAYATADSGFILMASYIAEPPPTMPHGNSELYVDNLSFDNLIVSIDDNNKRLNCLIYPNPASDFIIVETPNSDCNEYIINIYNILGKLILSKKMSQNQQKLHIGDLDSGIYSIEVKSKEETKKQKLIINN